MPCCKCEEHKWEDPQEVVYTDPEDGKEYCRFHAPAEHKYASLDGEKMSVRDFNAQVLERIQATIDLQEQTAVCNLNGTIFPGEFASCQDNELPSILLKAAIFKKDADFSGTTFGGSVTLQEARFERKASFKGALFKKIVDCHETCFGRGADFSGTTFGEAAVAFFMNARFEGGANFIGGIFKEEVSFRLAHFEWGVDFSDAHFEKLTSFTDVTFKRNATFCGVFFENEASFEHAHFKMEADFKNVHFGEAANFSKTDFNGVAFFTFIHFLEGANFKEASFGEVVYFGKSNFEWGGDFKETVFGGGANFTKACFGDEAVFTQASFAGNNKFDEVHFIKGASYTSAQFVGPVFFALDKSTTSTVKFAHCIVSSSLTFQDCDPSCLDFTQQRDLAKIHFTNAPWEKNGRIKACTEDEPDKLQLTRDFYQRMKAKYKAENNEYEASKWHIAEKEAQLKLLCPPVCPCLSRIKRGLYGLVDKPWSKGIVNRLSRFLDCVSRWFLFFALWLYKIISGFGEKPGRAFAVLLLLLFLPLLILTWLEVQQHFAWWAFDSVKVHRVIEEWLTFIPLTRVMDNKPELGGWHALRLFWQLLITLQAALFAFALRNNFRR